jgi:hypothetical protein
LTASSLFLHTRQMRNLFRCFHWGIGKRSKAKQAVGDLFASATAWAAAASAGNYTSEQQRPVHPGTPYPGASATGAHIAAQSSTTGFNSGVSNSIPSPSSIENTTPSTRKKYSAYTPYNSTATVPTQHQRPTLHTIPSRPVPNGNRDMYGYLPTKAYGNFYYELGGEPIYELDSPTVTSPLRVVNPDNLSTASSKSIESNRQPLTAAAIPTIIVKSYNDATGRFVRQEVEWDEADVTWYNGPSARHGYGRAFVPPTPKTATPSLAQKNIGNSSEKNHLSNKAIKRPTTYIPYRAPSSTTTSSSSSSNSINNVPYISWTTEWNSDVGLDIGPELNAFLRGGSLRIAANKLNRNPRQSPPRPKQTTPQRQRVWW